MNLNPCPFCGGEGLLHNSPVAKNLWRVTCKNCDAGPNANLFPESAINRWNRRAPAEESAVYPRRQPMDTAPTHRRVLVDFKGAGWIVAYRDPEYPAMWVRYLGYGKSGSWPLVSEDYALGWMDLPATSEDSRAPVEASSDSPEWRPTHRHVKRGTDYHVIGMAAVQSADDVAEGDTVIVYRGQDGMLWVRPRAEFFDGRFEPLPAIPAEARSDNRLNPDLLASTPVNDIGQSEEPGELCERDGEPCWFGEGDDAHWRCGTVQCGSRAAQGDVGEPKL